MYFDASSVDSFSQYGYSLKSYIVNNKKELGDKIKAHECTDIGQQQHSDWYRDYKAELINDLKELTEVL